MATEKEYRPFGDGWVARPNAGSDWKEVKIDDVPQEVLDHYQDLEKRQAEVAAGFHPDPNPPQFAKIIHPGDPDYVEEDK